MLSRQQGFTPPDVVSDNEGSSQLQQRQHLKFVKGSRGGAAGGAQAHDGRRP